MDKWNIKFLVCLGFVTSGIISFLAYNENGLELSVSVGIWISTILILESGKGISFFNYVRIKSKSWLVLWLSLMIISIVGNMCFLAIGAMNNENNKLSFEDVKSKKTSLENQIAYKKSQKESLDIEKKQSYSSLDKDKAEYQARYKELSIAINELQSQINIKNRELTDAIKKKYAKTPDIIKKQINTLTETLTKTISARDNLKQADNSTIISSQTSKINKLDDEINTLQTQINSISLADNSPTKKTAGIEVLFDYLGIEYKFAKFLMYLFIAVIFEIMICAFYLHGQGIKLADIKKHATPLSSKNPSEFNPIPNQEIIQAPKRIMHYKKKSPNPKITNEYPQIDMSPFTKSGTLQYGTSDIITTNINPIHFEPKKIIGFKKELPVKIEGLTDKNAIAFIDKMFETATNNKCIGYRKLSRLVGIKEGLGRQIFESLKQNGAIKVIDGVTTILKAKEDIKL